MLKFFVFLLIYKSKQHYRSTQTNQQTHYKEIFVMLKKAKKVKILLEFDFFKLILEKSFSDQKNVSSVCTTNYVVDFLLKIRKKHITCMSLIRKLRTIKLLHIFWQVFNRS